jgi:small-conductance mechanosensitive channel
LLKVHESEFGSEVGFDDRLLMLVSDHDAQALGRDRVDLANEIAQTMRTAIEQYRFERSRQNLLRGLIIALLATALLVALLFFLNHLYRRLMTAATHWIEAHVDAIRGKSGDLIGGTKLIASTTGALRLAGLTVLVAMLYAYLDLVLNLFPWTQPIAAQLTQLVLSPLSRIGKATVAEIPNIFFVLVVAVITRYALKFVRALFLGLNSGTITISGFYPDWAMPTYRIVRILVIAFAVVMAYPYIPGSDSEAFKGISIFLGVLVSLGSSSVVSNIAAGLTMVYMRSFKVGDRVKIADLIGYVTKTRLQVTHLRTVKNEEIIVPNSKIINSEVINYTSLARELGLVLHTQVRIGYQNPWRQVHALLLLAAERTEGILRDPQPFIRQKSLDSLYVTYELNVYSDDPPEMGRIYTDLHKNIQDAFNEYDVQIMSPNYENDRAERPVVPKERWYAAPAESPELVANGDGFDSPNVVE